MNEKILESLKEFNTIWCPILSLIIAIFSLLVTIFLSIFVPCYLNKKDRKRQKERDQEELEWKARLFIMENLEEKKYLLLAQLGAYLNPLENHCRKFYNMFNSCPASLQNEILKQANMKDIGNLDRYNREDFVKQLLEYYIEDVRDYCQQKIENYIVLNDFVIFEQKSIYKIFNCIAGNSYKQSDFNNCYNMFHEKISFEDIIKLINNYMLLKDELSSEPVEGIGENYGEEYLKKSEELSYIVGKIIKYSLEIMHENFYKDLINRALSEKKIFMPSDLNRLEDFYYFIMLHLYLIYHPK